MVWIIQLINRIPLREATLEKCHTSLIYFYMSIVKAMLFNEVCQNTRWQILRHMSNFIHVTNSINKQFFLHK